MMNELSHEILMALIVAALGVVGWIGQRIVKKLDWLDKHETKLQVHDVKLDEHGRRITTLEDA